MDPPLTWWRAPGGVEPLQHWPGGECWHITTPSGVQLLTVHSAPAWLAERMARSVGRAIAEPYVLLYPSASCCRSYVLGRQLATRINKET